MATILLVDDEKILRTLMAVALRRQEHAVLEAGTGRRAITVARKHGAAIDLLLSELSLPRMSGLDLAEKLAAQHPRMGAIFLSRGPHPAPLEAKARAVGYTVMPEPFNMEALLEQVQRQLGVPEGARKPPARSGASGSTGTRRKKTANGRAER